jgi:hypothetical protein
MDDYLKYRGKCKELAEEEIKKNPSLILVRGYYYDVVWGKEQHWWCKDENGKIVDPTKDQFPTKGFGEYEEYDGNVECSQCGTVLPEEKMQFDGRYAFCSTSCHLKFVGL